MLSRLSIACLLLTLVGCGDGVSTNPVTGTVTLDGKPIAGASITFQPVEGGTGMPAIGTTDSNGVYTLTDMRSEDVGGGAAAGDYRVGVLWFKPSANDTSNATGESGGSEESMKDDKAAHSTVSGPDALLPAAYQSPQTSGLTASVTSGSNTIDLTLTSDFKGAGAK